VFESFLLISSHGRVLVFIHLVVVIDKVLLTSSLQHVPFGTSIDSGVPRVVLKLIGLLVLQLINESLNPHTEVFPDDVLTVELISLFNVVHLQQFA
jgi:hypothetical protein